MFTTNLLYKTSYRINDKISIVIPKVGEVLEDESTYNNLVFLLTAMPIDMMVELDDMGVDFTQITDYDLFIIVFELIKKMDTRLVFGDLDLSKYKVRLSEDFTSMECVNPEDGTVIDRSTHSEIASVLRAINHLEADNRKPGNEEARKFMIERARKKKLRDKRKKKDRSQFEQLIVALVNTPEFHYGFEGTRELSIYQFYESLRQVMKKVEFDNRMIGVYAGTVNAKELSQDDLNWLTHK